MPADRLVLSSPRLAGLPEAQLTVAPGHVVAQTGDTGWLPSTSLKVEPLHVQGHTGGNAKYPSTHFDVRPWDIQLSLLGRSVRIRPFSVTV